jgi:hypothetical protein
MAAPVRKLELVPKPRVVVLRWWHKRFDIFEVGLYVFLSFLCGLLAAGAVVLR